MTNEQDEKAIKEELYQIKVKKIVLTIINVGMIAFIILISVFIYKHIVEFICIGVIFFLLIRLALGLIRGY